MWIGLCQRNDFLLHCSWERPGIFPSSATPPRAITIAPTSSHNVSRSGRQKPEAARAPLSRTGKLNCNLNLRGRRQ